MKEMKESPISFIKHFIPLYKIFFYSHVMQYCNLLHKSLIDGQIDTNHLILED